MNQTTAFEFECEQRILRKVLRPLEELRSGEVLVRVTCCTICGSDLHTFSGRRSCPNHCVLGHEIIGDVVAWAGQEAPLDFHGKPLEQGQRVSWCMAVGCDDCFYCRQGLPQKCVSLFKYGHEAGDDLIPTGGLSTHCRLVPGTAIFPLPDELPDEVASPANCATATVNAALRLVSQTHSIADANILITGAGMLGLTAAAMLHAFNAKQIIMVDPDSNRLRLASDFGAHHVVDATRSDELPSLVAEVTMGRGVDIAFDFAGVLSAVETCFHHTRIGGCLMLAGSTFPMDNLLLNPEQIVRRMWTIRGLHNYRPDDLDEAIAFLMRHQERYPFAKLVDKSFSLEDAPQAFAYAVKHRPIRVAVRP